MADNNLVSIAQQFTGLPMDSLIGGPLNAAATANASMAVTQTKFILDTCFEKNTDKTSGSDIYKPIMINMSLTRGVIQPQAQGANPMIEAVTTTFNLPLITIIPINSLGVDNVDITFEMEVKSSFSEEQSETAKNDFKAAASFEAKIGFGIFSATIKGSASYSHEDSTSHHTHYEKSNSAKYTVHVHAGQLPVPKGVNTIIEAYTQAIQPLTLPTGGGTTPKTT